MTIFINAGAVYPFAGDYILRVVDAEAQKAFSVLYFVDRSENTVVIVAVHPEPYHAPLV